MYRFFSHWKSEQAIPVKPPIHPYPNIVRICKSVRIIGQSLMYTYWPRPMIRNTVRAQNLVSKHDAGYRIVVLLGVVHTIISFTYDNFYPKRDVMFVCLVDDHDTLYADYSCKLWIIILGSSIIDLWKLHTSCCVVVLGSLRCLALIPHSAAPFNFCLI